MRNEAAAEREAWLEAVTNDPLLPGRILPSDYLGQQAWRRRVEVLQPSLKLRLGKPDACRAEAKRRRTHVQTRIALCKTLLHMQQKFVMRAGGNRWAATALRLGQFGGRWLTQSLPDAHEDEVVEDAFRRQREVHELGKVSNAQRPIRAR